jgi:hypothetical protein
VVAISGSERYAVTTKPNGFLDSVFLLGEHLGLVLVDDAGDMARRRVRQVLLDQADDLVVGDRGGACVASPPGGGEADAHDLDPPLLGAGKLLLQRASPSNCRL